MLCTIVDKDNSDVDHITCSRGLHQDRGPQVPYPWPETKHTGFFTLCHIQ